MDINTIGTLIGSLGFPIVACVAMGIYIKHLTKEHKEETDKLAEAIQNNTIVMNKILDRLERDSK